MCLYTYSIFNRTNWLVWDVRIALWLQSSTTDSRLLIIMQFNFQFERAEWLAIRYPRRRNFAMWSHWEDESGHGMTSLASQWPIIYPRMLGWSTNKNMFESNMSRHDSRLRLSVYNLQHYKKFDLVAVLRLIGKSSAGIYAYFRITLVYFCQDKSRFLLSFTETSSKCMQRLFCVDKRQTRLR